MRIDLLAMEKPGRNRIHPPMPLRFKIGKPYPFVKIQGDEVLFTLVTCHAGDGYGYTSDQGECYVVHEFMSEAECEQSLTQEGYRPLREFLSAGLLPANFALPAGERHGFLRLKS